MFRGRRVPGYPPLEPAKIQTFGLILADKNPGPFELEIDHISAYRGAAAGVSEASAQAGRAGRDRAQGPGSATDELSQHPAERSERRQAVFSQESDRANEIVEERERTGQR